MELRTVHSRAWRNGPKVVVGERRNKVSMVTSTLPQASLTKDIARLQPPLLPPVHALHLVCYGGLPCCGA
jgi:hypothetical protein